MLHKKLTGKIMEACFEVSNELGTGFLESVYQKALIIALKQKGFYVRDEVPLDVYFRKQLVGKFYADLLIEDKVLLELKVGKKLARQHFAQIINYLKATGIDVGMLINFGKPTLEYRRFDNRFLK